MGMHMQQSWLAAHTVVQGNCHIHGHHCMQAISCCRAVLGQMCCKTPGTCRTEQKGSGLSTHARITHSHTSCPDPHTQTPGACEQAKTMKTHSLKDADSFRDQQHHGTLFTDYVNKDTPPGNNGPPPPDPAAPPPLAAAKTL